MNQLDEKEKYLQMIRSGRDEQAYYGSRGLKKVCGCDYFDVIVEEYYRSTTAKLKLLMLDLCAPECVKNERAVPLGFNALKHKSKKMRGMGCFIIALTLEKGAVSELENARKSEKIPEIREDIDAAIDAIAHQNETYFVDRGHRGHLKSLFGTSATTATNLFDR